MKAKQIEAYENNFWDEEWETVGFLGKDFSVKAKIWVKRDD